MFLLTYMYIDDLWLPISLSLSLSHTHTHTLSLSLSLSLAFSPIFTHLITISYYTQIFFTCFTAYVLRGVGPGAIFTRTRRDRSFINLFHAARFDPRLLAPGLVTLVNSTDSSLLVFFVSNIYLLFSSPLFRVMVVIPLYFFSSRAPLFVSHRVKVRFARPRPTFYYLANSTKAWQS